MKNLVVLFLATLIYISATSQVAINTTGETPAASAILDISSTSGGVLIPRLLTTEINSIQSPANGLLVYNTEIDNFWYHDMGLAGWVEIITSSTNSLNNLTDGISDGTSVFIGSEAGTNDNGNNSNTGIGIDALHTNTNGYYNSALGHKTLYYNTSGIQNTASGYRSLYTNTTGYNNTASGFSSLKLNTTGNENTAFGAVSMFSNTTGSLNTAYGAYSLHSNTLGIYNIAIGHLADAFNQQGSNNTIIGSEAGKGTATHNKSGNIFLGFRAGYNETGSNKLYIENSNSSTPLIGGDFANDSIFLNGIVRITGGSPGTDKILTSDANGNTTWEPNTAATEIQELSDGKNDGYSIFIGIDAGLNDDASANQNTGVGNDALKTNTSGSFNSALGFRSLTSNTTGYENSSLGQSSLGSNTSGYQNTALGSSSLISNTTGQSNTGAGVNSLKANTTGSSNCAFGAYSIMKNTTGNFNTVMGVQSDYYNDGGSNNVIIGYQAGRATATHNKSGNIFLGYQAGYNETGSDKLYIENSNSSNPLIGGDFNTDEVYFNTLKLGIGTSIPRELLEVASPTNGYGRMIVSDGGGDSRNALLFVSPTSTNQTARIEAYNYGTSTGLTLNFNTTGDGQCIFGGNVLPEGHKSENLGASGTAWDNVYADDYITEGSAAFSNIKVTDELINYPPQEKVNGSFDEYTDKGLKELDPASLPEALRENNALLIDEITTYNYKANYEQQMQIETLKEENAMLKARLVRLEKIVSGEY